ncbi:MAG TPA: hypothetical protein VNJ28_05290, partial [Candidatus Limnocylindrales bacterium]|nr:hypothetical protein [Candidatus Limnocylindrales bacterium]
VEEAARLGTRHPLLLYHAGTIAAAVGDRERAAADLREALALDAGFSPLGAAEARRLLQRLGG